MKLSEIINTQWFSGLSLVSRLRIVFCQRVLHSLHTLKTSAVYINNNNNRNKNMNHKNNLCITMVIIAANFD